MEQDLYHTLQESIDGEVRTDAISRKVYSVDASIYEIEPLAAVLPKTKEDIVRVVTIAKQHGVPVVARGAATGITGGCLCPGIVLDLSKYLNKVLEINYDEAFAICEPGVVQDALNAQLADKGYRLGPDTSTGNRATIGGMVANNSAGSRSLKYGTMVDSTLAIEMVLASGAVVRFGACNKEEWEKKCLLAGDEGQIYREVSRIRKEYRDEIEKRFPKIPRRVSGYNLDTLLAPAPYNLSQLITGSEGTLGIITEIKVKICPMPQATSLCILHFDNLNDGLRALDTILKYNPIAVEMIDNTIIEMGKHSPSIAGKLDWLQGAPKAIFAVELEGELGDFARAMREKNIGYAQVCLTDPKTMSHVWEVRKAGLGLLLSKKSYSRAIAFIEDLSIPPHRLADFMEAFQQYLRGINKEAGIYGHVGSGCIHLRPFMDLRSQEELELMQQIMRDVAKMALEYGGSLSGEHGDGLVRSWLLEAMYGTEIMNAFEAIKGAFDPDNRMNPGKIAYPEPFTEHLRLGPETPIHEIETFLDFSKEGGLALAADMCNGNAQCRKSDKTMCPSFQASGDEYHTTRARAQTLRAIIHGKLPLDALTDDGLRNVLDLCLECKGCKTECPSEVDMAKMKSEILYQYQEKHGYSLRTRLFGYVGRVNALSAPFAKLFNTVSRTALAKRLLSYLGIAPERDLPPMATQRFSRWQKKNLPEARGKKVLLFNDTFNEFNTPEIGIAAVKVLQALGYTPHSLPWQCCGRPMISKGMLRQAKQYAATLVKMLKPYADQGIPIVGLEPSCLLSIRDDYQGLLGYGNDTLTAVSQQCYTFDEFLANHIQDGQLPLQFDPSPRHITFHGHCYQKALTGTDPTHRVLRCLPGTAWAEIPSGCCGMAGTFGYEKEHYHVSMQIAETRLFPGIRRAPEGTTLVADGFSCRNQILHGTQKKARHLAEIIAEALA